MLPAEEALADAKRRLLAAADIGDHLTFIQKFAARYEWPQPAVDHIRGALEAIRARQADKDLYLGVVGEFSSGKTTFINALMRDDLLKTDVLQATTATATWMRYGDQLDVEVTFQDGEQRSYRRDGITLWNRFTAWFKRPSFGTEKSRLRDFIHRTTAEEAVAATLAGVTIFHPSDAFRRGLVIIDTPGINAANPRHAEVTTRAVREQCDAAIVVIPADVPVSQSLLAFIGQHLSDSVHRCVFLVTKLDLIRRPTERERLLRTIPKRLEAALGVSNLSVLAVAPRTVVDQVTAEEEENPQAAEAFRREFAVVEAEIWQTLGEQREVILMERLTVLMSQLLAWIPQALDVQENEYRRRHEALLRSQIPDLAGFTAARRAYHRQHLAQSSAPLRELTLSQIRETRNGLLREVEAAVMAVESKAGLKGVVDETIAPRITFVKGWLGEQVAARLDELGGLVAAELAAFEAEFQALYRQLSTLGGAIDYTETLSSRSLAGNAHHGLAAVAAGIAAEQESAALRTFGGAGAGAAIGTMLMPGIGTVIGGALGWFAGALFGPSLPELKQKCFSQLRETIDAAFSQTHTNVSRAFDQAVFERQLGLAATIDRYFAHYGQLVAQMIERDRQEAQRLEAKREMIRRDLRDIETRRATLERGRAVLRQAGRGSLSREGAVRCQ